MCAWPFGHSVLLLHFPFQLHGLVQTSLWLSKAHRDHFALVTASVFDFVAEESHGATQLLLNPKRRFSSANAEDSFPPLPLFWVLGLGFPFLLTKLWGRG